MRGNSDAIQAFASEYRLKTRTDEDGTKIIPGRFGHLYLYDNGVLGAIVTSDPPRRQYWGCVRAALLKAGFTIVQDGDREGAAIFDPANATPAKMAIRAVAVRRRRQISPDQRDKQIARLRASAGRVARRRRKGPGAWDGARSHTARSGVVLDRQREPERGRAAMVKPRPIAKPTSVPGTRERKQLVPVWEGTEYPRHPPGTYDMQCNKLQGPEWLRLYQRWSVRLACNFLTDHGEVSGFLNLGNERERPRVGRQSKYFKLWCQANGGIPRKGQSMSPDTFLGKFFRVRIETGTKNSKGERKSEAEQYSRIVEFLECIGP